MPGRLRLMTKSRATPLSTAIQPVRSVVLSRALITQTGMAVTNSARTAAGQMTQVPVEMGSMMTAAAAETVGGGGATTTISCRCSSDEDVTSMDGGPECGPRQAVQFFARHRCDGYLW